MPTGTRMGMAERPCAKEKGYIKGPSNEMSQTPGPLVLQVVNGELKRHCDAEVKNIAAYIVGG